MRWIAGTMALWLAASLGSTRAHAAELEGARIAARLFGRALITADASLLKPLLPERGKVRMRLHCPGPEEGFYSGSQVEAVLADYMRLGKVRSFELLGVEGDEHDYAMAHGRAQTTNLQGRPKERDFHLTFQLEGARWVLREIREAPP